MIPVSDFVEDLYHQPASNAESKHADSQFVNDIFGPDRRSERMNKFLPKTRTNSKMALPKPFKSCAAEVPSYTLQVPDSFGIKSPVEISVDAMCLEGSVSSTMVSPTPCVVQDLRSDSEIPISSNVLNVVAQLDEGCSQQEKDMAHCLKSLDGDAQAASNFVPMIPVSDFVEDLSHQPESNAESKHADPRFVDDIFGPDRQSERMNKFRPKTRTNSKKALPKPFKSCAAEVPSYTSQVPDSFGIKSPVEISIDTSCLQGSVSSTMVSPTPCVVQDLISDSEIPICSNVLNVVAQLDKGCSQQEKDMACHLKSLDGDAQASSNFGIVDDSQSNDIQQCENTTLEFNANVRSCSTPDVGIPVELAQDGANGSQSCSFMQISEENAELSCVEDLSRSVFDVNPVRDKDEDVPKTKKKRKAPCKSTCTSLGQNESAKGCKKASEKSEAIVKDPAKKRLPHGSRRKRAKRLVDKALLEIPDDELDRRQLAIRDLIRLAEFKERTLNKVAAAFKNSSVNLSDSFRKINNVNDKDYNEEHEEDSNCDGANESIPVESARLNYHSYMKRPQKTRWSKMDTELFYQAIRQFGTDFAMIQLLFTNRSREQVKAKFKNEQRKHPLEIADALVFRSKDHSQFEKVIRHLKEQNLNKEERSDQATKSQDDAEQNEEEMIDPEKREDDVCESWNSHKSDDWEGDVLF